MLCVGVDIGTYSIKVADLEPTSKGFVIRRLQEFPYSLDITKDRKIETIDVLRTLFTKYDLSNTHFVFGLGQKYVSGRFLAFPFRERFKVQKAVVSELEDELPFSQEDAIFDVKITRYQGKGSDVLAMAVPKERISELVDLAHDCGVEPQLISTEGMALANLFERWNQPPPEAPSATTEIPAPRQAEVVLNIGHTSTQMLVFSDGLLLGTRHIDWGAKNLADAISAKYSLNYVQAMKELQSKGFVLLDKGQGSREQITFSQVLEGALQNLQGDVRLKLLELESELSLQWSKGWITGGGAQLKNLGAYLTQHFQIPFNRYKQFEGQSISFEEDAHLEMVGNVAVGLAIEGLRRPRNPATNFMKGEFVQQSRFFEAVWDQWGYTAQVAGAAFAILVGYSIMRDSLSASLADQSDQVLRKQAEAIAGIKSRQATPERIGKFISTQEKLDKARKQAEKVVRINSALDILEGISTALPPRERVGMEIKRVSIDADLAEVHGYTANEQELELILKALQGFSANGKAERVDLRIPVPQGKVGFAYRLPINRYSGG